MEGSEIKVLRKAVGGGAENVIESSPFVKFKYCFYELPKT